MDEQSRTDKDILKKGIKRLAICLVLMFLGPTLVHLTLSNDDKPLYIPLLIVSILLCILAIVMLFIGLNTIMDSMFKRKNYNSIINKIELIRSKNNINWMNLLRLAFKYAPNEANKIIKKINADDKKISKQLQKLQD